MTRDFEGIFRPLCRRLAYVAAYALGNDARSASAAQKRAFSGRVQTPTSRRKYGKRFREFIGGRLEVQGVKAVKNQLRGVDHRLPAWPSRPST